MENRTIEFCCELQGETDLAWIVFDDTKTIQILKSQVLSMRRINDADAILEIPLRLAREMGVV